MFNNWRFADYPSTEPKDTIVGFWQDGTPIYKEEEIEPEDLEP